MLEDKPYFCVAEDSPTRDKIRTVTQSPIYGFFLGVFVVFSCCVNQVDPTGTYIPETIRSWSVVALQGVLVCDVFVRGLWMNLLLHASSALLSSTRWLQIPTTTIIILGEFGLISSQLVEWAKAVQPLLLICFFVPFQRLLTTIRRSMMLLLSTIMFIGILLGCFAIVANSLWPDGENRRCLIPAATTLNSTDDQYINLAASINVSLSNGTILHSDASCGGLSTCPVPFQCNFPSSARLSLPHQAATGLADEQKFWPILRESTSMVHIFSPERLPTSWLRCLKVITKDGWVDDVDRAGSADGVPAVLFFIALALIGRYLLLSVFLSILLCEFNVHHNALRKQNEDSDVAIRSLLIVEDSEEKEFSRLQKPENASAFATFRRGIYLLVDSVLRPANYFLTLLNLLALGSFFSGMPDEMRFYGRLVVMGTMPLVPLELVLRLCSSGPLPVARNAYNWIDLAVSGNLVYEFLFDKTTGFSSLRGFRLFEALYRSYKAQRAQAEKSGAVMKAAAALYEDRGVNARQVKSHDSANEFQRMITEQPGALARVGLMFHSLFPAIQDVTEVILLILVINLSYALAGISLFGTLQLKVDRPIRPSFHSLWESGYTLFLVLATEWSDIFIATYRASDNRAVVVIYFISLFIMNTFVLVNLVTAAVFYHFERVVDADWEAELAMERAEADAMLDVSYPPRMFLPQPSTSVTKSIRRTQSTFVRRSVAAAEIKRLPQSTTVPGVLPQAMLRPLDVFLKEEQRPTILLQGHSLRYFGPDSRFRRTLAAIVFSNWFGWVTNAITLLNVIFLTIDASRALVTGFLSDSLLNSIFRVSPYCFAGVFFTEVLIKVIVFGGFSPKGSTVLRRSGVLPIGMAERADVLYPAFFLSGFNILAVIVAISSILGLFVPVFKVLRSLRTLSFVLRLSGVRVAASSLARSLPYVIRIVSMGLFVWVVIGVIGVHLFSSEMSFCSDPSVEHRLNCTNTTTIAVFQLNSTSLLQKQFAIQQSNVTLSSVSQTMIAQAFYQSYDHVRHWVSRKPPVAFDHLGIGLLSLFIASTGESMTEFVYGCTDTVGSNYAMMNNASPISGLYAVLVFIIGSYFVLNSFIAVPFTYFMKFRKIHDGTLFLTDDQVVFVLASEVIDSTIGRVEQPAAPTNALRRVCHWIVYANPLAKRKMVDTETYVDDTDEAQGTYTPVEPSSMFDSFIGVIIVINIVPLIWTSSESNILSLATTAVFTLEVIFRMLADGAFYYFKQWQNRYDFFVALCGVFDSLLLIPAVSEAMGDGVTSQLKLYLPFVAILRIGRLVKLLNRIPTLQKLFAMVLHGLPSLASVVVLLVVFMFIFGLLGVDLFGKLELNGQLTEVNNFRTAPNAMLLLFQITSLEKWNAFMEACSVQEPNCSESQSTCGRSYYAIPYFVLYVIVNGLLMLQLCVAIVVDTFHTLDKLAARSKEVFSLARALRLGWCSQVHKLEGGRPSRRHLLLSEFLLFLRLLPAKYLNKLLQSCQDFSFSPNAAWTASSDALRMLKSPTSTFGKEETPGILTPSDGPLDIIRENSPCITNTVALRVLQSFYLPATVHDGKIFVQFEPTLFAFLRIWFKVGVPHLAIGHLPAFSKLTRFHGGYSGGAGSGTLRYGSSSLRENVFTVAHALAARIIERAWTGHRLRTGKLTKEPYIFTPVRPPHQTPVRPLPLDVASESEEKRYSEVRYENSLEMDEILPLSHSPAQIQESPLTTIPSPLTAIPTAKKLAGKWKRRIQAASSVKPLFSNSNSNSSASNVQSSGRSDQRIPSEDGLVDF